MPLFVWENAINNPDKLLFSFFPKFFLTRALYLLKFMLDKAELFDIITNEDSAFSESLPEIVRQGLKAHFR